MGLGGRHAMPIPMAGWTGKYTVMGTSGAFMGAVLAQQEERLKLHRYCRCLVVGQHHAQVSERANYLASPPSKTELTVHTYYYKPWQCLLDCAHDVFLVSAQSFFLTATALLGPLPLLFQRWLQVGLRRH